MSENAFLDKFIFAKTFLPRICVGEPANNNLASFLEATDRLGRGDSKIGRGDSMIGRCKF